MKTVTSHSVTPQSIPAYRHAHKSWPTSADWSGLHTFIDLIKSPQPKKGTDWSGLHTFIDLIKSPQPKEQTGLVYTHLLI